MPRSSASSSTAAPKRLQPVPTAHGCCRTWPNKGYFYSKDIDFVDQRHGWAVGNFNSIIRTVNGGQSWEEIRVPTDADLSMIDFLDLKTGYVAGSISRKDRSTGTLLYGLEILSTSDGGVNWRTCYKDNKSSDVFGIVTITEKIAVLSVDGNILLRTEDGGLTWQSVASGDWSFLDVIFNTSRIGWAVGRHGFYRSADEGKSWQKLENLPQSLSNQSWSSIAFADARNGVAVSNEGVIAITSDGGETWSDARIYLKDRLKKVRLNGRSGIILGAEKVYILNLDVRFRGGSSPA